MKRTSRSTFLITAAESFCRPLVGQDIRLVNSLTDIPWQSTRRVTSSLLRWGEATRLATELRSLKLSAADEAICRGNGSAARKSPNEVIRRSADCLREHHP